MENEPEKNKRQISNPNLRIGGPGRKAGVPNKATQNAREAIALFVDTNAWQLQEWLGKIANGVKEKGRYKVEPNPQKAFELFMSVVEYHVPKLQRTDVLSIIKHDTGDVSPLPQYVTAEEAARAYQEAIK